MSAVINALPTVRRNTVDVFLAPGHYPFNANDNPLSFATATFGGAVGDASMYDPFVNFHGAYSSIYGTLTATAASTGATITDSSLVTVADANFGNVIHCITGANAGQYLNIIDNDAAGTFYSNIPWLNPVSIGDTFEVLTPSVFWDINGFLTLSSTGGRVTFNAMNISTPPDGGLGVGPPNCGGGCVMFSGCDINVGFLGSEGGSLQGYSFYNFGLGSVVRNAFIGQGGDISATANFGGFLAMQNCGFSATANAYITFGCETGAGGVGTLHTRNTSFSFFNSTLNMAGANSNGLVTVFSEIRGNGGYSTLVGTDGSRFLIDGININSGGVDAITIESGSFASLSETGAGVGGTGNNNGLVVSDMSTASVYGAGTLTTVTGSGSDVFINGTGGGGFAYADIVAGTDGGITTNTLCRVQSK